jgi:uncharacterized protein (TIGR02145 family)
MIKKPISILWLWIAVIYSGSTFAQTAVGGNTPDDSAMLDVQSSTKGVLFPRMTTAERDLIQDAATGLMIFNTTENRLQINMGNPGPGNASWQSLEYSGFISGLNCGAGVLSGILINGQAASNVSVSIPYTGGNGGAHLGQSVSSTGVSGLTATLSRGSFESGAGNLTYNITGTPGSTGTASFALNIGGQSCTLSASVSVLGTITTINCTTAIRQGEMQPNLLADGVSVIVPYTGGDGGGHTGQTVTSTGVTGYTATLAAGNFASGDGNLTYTITGTGTTTGTATFALNIGGQTCNLDLSVRSCSAKVNATDTKIFHCYNLGAYNTRADPFTPSYEIIGHYYQWGRNPSCFGTDGIDAPNPCTSPVYGAAGPWGSTTNEDNAGAITGWINNTSAADTDWTDTPSTKGPQDPCPKGFRVPSRDQWLGVIENNTITNEENSGGSWFFGSTNYDIGKKFGNDLFLPAAGNRGFNAGTLFSRGFDGHYWSSTVSGSVSSRLLYFNSGAAYMNSNGRTLGLSLRCVAE